MQDHMCTVYSQAVCTEPIVVSLYRLFGFSLFASIRFRRKVVFGKLRKHSTTKRKKSYCAQLQILQSLLETDKTILPAALKYQDRGRMIFPNRLLLPFCKEVSKVMRTTLCGEGYKSNGRQIIFIIIIFWNVFILLIFIVHRRQGSLYLKTMN